jgi:hypothetical protein
MNLALRRVDFLTLNAVVTSCSSKIGVKMHRDLYPWESFEYAVVCTS